MPLCLVYINLLSMSSLLLCTLYYKSNDQLQNPRYRIRVDCCFGTTEFPYWEISGSLAELGLARPLE